MSKDRHVICQTTHYILKGYCTTLANLISGLGVAGTEWRATRSKHGKENRTRYWSNVNYLIHNRWLEDSIITFLREEEKRNRTND